MTISKYGEKFIQRWENCVLKPYKDIAGKLTIGWGHLILLNEIEELNKPITQEQADLLFDTDIKKHDIGKYLTKELKQNEYDALCSLAYNIGLGNFQKSTILKLINQDAKLDREKEAFWKSWNRSDGKISNGLKNRRDAEWNLFVGGNYGI
jgi:GH24 family phage-related lysozyme (muramidase)